MQLPRLRIQARIRCAVRRLRFSAASYPFKVTLRDPMDGFDLAFGHRSRSTDPRAAMLGRRNTRLPAPRGRR